MPLSKIIRLNILFLIALAFYGLITDEPYWRSNGHDPYLFDYFFWLMLFINGPSGFLADYLSGFVTNHDEIRFIVQYLFWCVFLNFQWKLYDRFIYWSFQSNQRKNLFYFYILFATMIGSILAHKGWNIGHQPSDLFIDQYFWFVRFAGIACSGLIILGYTYFVKNTHSAGSLP